MDEPALHEGRLADPIPPTEEGILFAEIDFSAILAAKNAADPVGHYSRPDALRLVFNKSQNRVVVDASVTDPRASVEVSTPDADLEELHVLG